MANEKTITLNESIGIGGITLGGSTLSFSADTQVGFQKTIPAGSTDVEIDLPAITVANVIAMVLSCDKAVTVKTNSSSSPTETIALAAGHNLRYITGDPAANKWTAATTLTKLYVTNSGSADALFKYGFAVDGTPGIAG